MRSKYFDSFIILSQLLVFAYTGYKLFIESSDIQTSSNIQLAHIEAKRATVKKRLHGFLSWKDVIVQDAVNDGDRIFTHDKSQVVIRFADKSKLVLQENALVKIERGDNEQVSLDVKKGGVVVETTGAMQLRVGDVKIASSGTNNAKISIESTGTENKVLLISGKATLENKKGKEKLSLNHSVHLNTGGDILKIKKMSVSLVAPTAGKMVLIDSNQDVILEWDRIEASVDFDILISSDAGFKETLYRKRAPLQAKKLKIEDLEEGTYYWKAAGAKGDDLSAVGIFNVVKIRAPQIMRPLKDEVYVVNETLDLLATYSVQIAWERGSAESYQVEIIDQDQKKKLYKGSKHSLIFDPLPIGQYRVRVGAIFGDKIKWSQSRSFTIRLNPLPVAPELKLLSAYYGRKLAFELKPKENIRYRVKVFFENEEVEDEEFEGGQYHLNVAKYGDYCVAVVAIDSLDRPSKKEIRSCFSLIPQAPQLKKVSNNIYYSNDFEGVSLAWHHQDNIQFQLQVAHDRLFKKIIIDQQLEEKEFFWKRPDVGIYYFRVRALEGPYSKPLKINIQELPRLEAPILTPGEVFELGFKPSKKSWWDLIISRAHAGEFKSVIKWKAIDLAKEYYLEIFADKQAKRAILKATIYQAKFDWEDAKPGTYYWRLSFMDRFGRQSPVSKLVRMRIAPSSKWRQESARKKFSPPWELTFSLAPASIDYQLSDSFYEINIDGGALTSAEGSFKYQFQKNIFLGGRSSLLSGPVLESNFVLFDQAFRGEYLFRLTPRFLLKVLLGMKFLLIQHSDPISTSKLTPITGLEAIYGARFIHKFELLLGTSFFSGGYYFVVPLSPRWYGLLGGDYRKESLSYEVNEVDMSYFRFMVGGGVRF